MSTEFSQRNPDARITVRDGRLTIATASGMSRRGWAGLVARQLADRGVHLADIHVLASDEDLPELVVRFLAEGRDVEGAKDVIAGWALATGYARVWFGDELRDFTDMIPPSGDVSVVCPTCSALWVESDLDFWLMVRDHGSFPSACPTCGATLPQWTVGATCADGSPTAQPLSASTRQVPA